MKIKLFLLIIALLIIPIVDARVVWENDSSTSYIVPEYPQKITLTDHLTFSLGMGLMRQICFIKKFSNFCDGYIKYTPGASTTDDILWVSAGDGWGTVAIGDEYYNTTWIKVNGARGIEIKTFFGNNVTINGRPVACWNGNRAVAC